MQLDSNPLVAIADPIENLIINFLGIGGDDSISDLNVDGSGLPVFAWWESPAITIVSSVTVWIMDSGWQVNEFAGLGILANGLRLAVVDVPENEAAANEIGPGLTVTHHHDWSVICSASDIHEARTTDTRGVYVGTWRPGRTTGRPLKISAGEGLLATINDDLSGLTRFKILVNGIRPR